jgi:hypothetical protein
MRVRSHLNVASRLGTVPEAQHGYFTRAQAAEAGVEDFELARAVTYLQIRRLGHGVYRVAGAGTDLHQDLRVVWFRLAPTLSPRQRTHRPTLWVSHQSAATVLELGAFLPDTPEFISTQRLQPRVDAHIRVRRNGLSRDEWIVRDGFAVTSPARTLADLARVGHDGGHLGLFAADALTSGAATTEQLQAALGRRHNLDVLLELADKTGRA